MPQPDQDDRQQRAEAWLDGRRQQTRTDAGRTLAVLRLRQREADRRIVERTMRGAANEALPDEVA